MPFSSSTDFALASFYLFCLWGNVSVDIWMGFDIDLRTTGYTFHEIVHQSGKTFDPLFLENSFYMRYSALLTAVVYAPYYVLASITLYRGDGLGKHNSMVRYYAWFYAVGMFLNMTIVLILELIELYKQSPLAPTLGLYWIACGSYWLTPLLVWLRLKNEHSKRKTV